MWHKQDGTAHGSAGRQHTDALLYVGPEQGKPLGEEAAVAVLHQRQISLAVLCTLLKLLHQSLDPRRVQAKLPVKQCVGLVTAARVILCLRGDILCGHLQRVDDMQLHQVKRSPLKAPKTSQVRQALFVL